MKANASMLLLAKCGLLPIGNLLLYPLETRFPPWVDTGGSPDGIVILGGAIVPDMSAAHSTPLFGPSIDRIMRQPILHIAIRTLRSFQGAMPAWIRAIRQTPRDHPCLAAKKSPQPVALQT